MIEITHARWGKKSIGIAHRKLKHGRNIFKVTVKGKDGEPYYPGFYEIDREAAIAKYGIEEINKNHLTGIFIPFEDLKKMKIEEEKENEQK